MTAELRRLVRFGAVGACNTVITLISYAALDGVGVIVPAASAIAFAIGAANGYVLNSRWTFGARDRDPAMLARYVLVQGSGAMMSAGGVRVTTEVLRLHHLAGEIAILPFVTITTYLLSRRFVFRIGRVAA